MTKHVRMNSGIPVGQEGADQIRRALANAKQSAHPNCVDGHVCQKPSGRRCYEQPCDEPAGTLWGPHWCPEHDKQRLENISAAFAEMERVMTEPRP